MATYVNNLRLKEIATGDSAGTWGSETNTNLELIGQALGYGTRAIANASTDNITIADGASDADRSMYLKLTGGGQACTVTILPNTVSKVWWMENATSYTLTFTCGSGANVAILAGETKCIATDGAGSGGVVYDVLTDVNLAGTTKTAALTNAGALSNQGTVTVGVDDTGYDVKFFGATTGKSLLWDESADSLIVTGTTTLVGTTNLDAVDIDGAVQIDAAFTSGVDGQGYDTKFFGDTASAYLLWDTSADDLILGGAAGLIVPDGKFTLASTAVTSTAAELNILDGVTSTAAELNILDGVTSTAAELNILDGVTATTAELNYLDIATLGLTAASKAVTADANGVITLDNGFSEEYAAVASSSAAVSLDLRTASNFSHDLTENTTISFANPAASGKVSAATLRIIQGSTARTITWNSSIKWASDTAPTLTTTDDGVDIFVFYTVDGGTTYYGFTAGQAMS